MLALILLLLLGSAFAFLALQNTVQVTVTLAQYSFAKIPLFAVMISSLFLGVLLALVFYLAHLVTSSLTIRDKNRKLKDMEVELADLTKKLHQLELENARLKKETGEEEVDERSL